MKGAYLLLGYPIVESVAPFATIDLLILRYFFKNVQNLGSQYRFDLLESYYEERFTSESCN